MVEVTKAEYKQKSKRRHARPGECISTQIYPTLDGSGTKKGGKNKIQEICTPHHNEKKKTI